MTCPAARLQRTGPGTTRQPPTWRIFASFRAFLSGSSNPPPWKGLHASGPQGGIDFRGVETRPRDENSVHRDTTWKSAHAYEAKRIVRWSRNCRAEGPGATYKSKAKSRRDADATRKPGKRRRR